MKKKAFVRYLSFDFFCTEKEFRTAYVAVLMRCGRLQFWWVALLTALLLTFYNAWQQVCGVYAVFSLRSTGVLAVSCAVLLGYYLYAVNYVKKRFRHYWRNYRKLGMVRYLTSYSGGVIIANEIFRSQIPFADCKVLIDRADMLIIVQNPRSFIVVPKRYIPEEKREGFLNFLHHAFERPYILRKNDI